MSATAFALLPLLVLLLDETIVGFFFVPLGKLPFLLGAVLPFGVVLDRRAIQRAATLRRALSVEARRSAALFAVLSAVSVLPVLGAAYEQRLVLAASASLLVRGPLVFLLRRAERRGWGRERIAVLGDTPAARRLAQRLARPALRGIAVAGIFDETEASLASLLELGRQGRFDRVLIAVPAADPARAARVARRLRALDVEVEQFACLCQSDWGGAPLCHLDAIPLAHVARRPIPPWGLAIKTVHDRLLSLLLLIIVLPVLVVATIAIRLDSSGPILFRQQRDGRNGAVFEILKFRTMTWQPPDRDGRVIQTARGDRRVTRVGRVLRATSLDELPQLLNVLRGDMSLVGPRPHPATMTTENRLSVEIADDYPHRHRVRPGMTGLAQINGSRGALSTAEELCRRLRYDLDYIENWSPWLDLRITLLTPLKLIFHGGSAF